jgi:hypothetical protein
VEDLGCKLEDKNIMDYITAGKAGMDWVHVAKDRDSIEHNLQGHKR